MELVPDIEEQAPKRAIEHFPYSAPEGQTLLKTVYDFAEERGEAPLVVKSRQDLAAWALDYANQYLEPGSVFAETWAIMVLREIYEDGTGETLVTDANKHLRRLIRLAGPKTTLNCLVEAIVAGAGLGEGYEDDPRAVVKYAAAIYRRRYQGRP